MKDLRNVREMFGLGMQNGGELPVMFEQGNAPIRDPINGRLRAESPFTDGQEPGLNQSSDPPAEAVAGTFVPAKCHQLEQLLMACKLRVAHLPEQRYIAVGLDDDTVFRVAHNRNVRRSDPWNYFRI